jgi:hypothetical protein
MRRWRTVSPSRPRTGDPTDLSGPFRELERARADIHDGEERKRSVHGPDTEAQDLSPPIIIFGLQRAAGQPRRIYPAQLQALLRAKSIDAEVTNPGVPFETTAMNAPPHRRGFMGEPQRGRKMHMSHQATSGYAVADDGRAISHTSPADCQSKCIVPVS